jgi:phosphoribosylanthranilate isomerase
VDQAVPKIKFCGITDLDDAEAAVNAGAWALGVILWPGSPRRCRPEVAAQIAAAHRRHVQIAGVFVNATLDQVARAADEIGLSLLQLHGDEGPAFCAFHTDFHLLDSYARGIPGGTGETFAWELARAHSDDVPMILSGGLRPDNVGDAIAAVRPYAVDVASGVELSPGRKDHDKLRAFADAVAASASVVRAG